MRQKPPILAFRETTAFVRPYVFETKEEFMEFMAIRDSREEYYKWDEDGNIFVNVDSVPVAPGDTVLDDENIDEDFTYDESLRELENVTTATVLAYGAFGAVTVAVYVKKRIALEESK